jgi:predicted alpha/beta hydrolase
MSAVEQHSISLQNGLAAEAVFYRPAGEAKGAVLLVPAMGVAQRYYAPLAEWLAGQGYAAATFDFCGIGLSHNGGLRKLTVNILDWARYDCDAMLAAAAGLAPGRPLYWLGHSLGGQILGFVPGPERIARAVMVGAGSGYWAEAPAAVKRKAWWLWHVIAPVSTRLFGYFPGGRLRIVADLPRGVMEQWRRWCMDPDYAIGVEGPAARAAFAAVTTPITSLSFVDDELISARAVAALHNFYFNAPTVMKRISPRDIGAERIGHFGFFNARFEQALWQDYLLPELS